MGYHACTRTHYSRPLHPYTPLTLPYMHTLLTHHSTPGVLPPCQDGEGDGEGEHDFLEEEDEEGGDESGSNLVEEDQEGEGE